MIDTLLIFFQGLLLLFLLHVIGHPLVNAVLRRFRVPSVIANLDFIQRLPLDFVVGGAVIYVWALIMTPFHGFVALSCWVLIAVAAGFYIYQYWKKIALFKKPSLYSCVVLAFFFLTLAIRVAPLSSFVLGSNQDVSWHTLITYSIVRNGGVPLSVIDGFILQTPVGVQTILAYVSLISGIPPEIIAFGGLVFFSAIIGLAAYLFGSVIGSQRFGFCVSLLMVSITLYPSAITWGSDWLLLGLITFFVSAALVISYSFESFELNRSTILAAVFPGVATGFLAATYIPLYVILILTAFFMIVFGRKRVVHRLKGLAIILLTGLPLFAIWLYRFFFMSQSSPPYVAQQAANLMDSVALHASAIFLPLRNFSSPFVVANTVKNWFTWDYQNGWAGAYVLVPLLIMGCFLLLLRFSLRHKLGSFRTLVPRYLIGLFFVIILWGLNGPLGLFHFTNLGLGIMMTELDKIAPIMGTILLPFVAAYSITSICIVVSKKPKTQTKALAVTTIIFISFSVAIIPLNQTWLVGNYGIFATATEPDYQLLKWMHTEIPSNANVLVNPYGPGQYVPSIGGQHAIEIASTGVVFPNQQYQAICQQIVGQVFNSTALSLLRDLKVDYIFVDSKAFQDSWQPSYFLENPQYFRLVHNVGSSYLFAFEPINEVLSSGVINESYLMGYLGNVTFLDLRNMRIQNLATADYVYIQLDLKDNSGQILENMNHWSPANLIKTSKYSDPKNSMSFSLVGSSYSFNLTVSLNYTGSINLMLSAENAPLSSLVVFSYFPIYEVRQNEFQFTTDKIVNWFSSNNLPVQGISQNSTTAFQITPYKGQVYTFDCYISIWSNSSIDCTIQTKPLD